MSNFLLQDIYYERDCLNFPLTEEHKSTLIAFRHCMAEPTPNEILKEDTMFQILDVRDPTRSTMSMIEELTNLVNSNEGFYDRSSMRTFNSAKSRRIAVNEVDINEEQEDMNAKVQAATGTIIRLSLQDCFGNLCYAYLYDGYPSNTANIFKVHLGSKIVIYKGAKLSFNTLHLTRENYKFLGGHIKKYNFELYKRKLKELKNEIQYEG
jgi:hypothetical protein